MEVKNIDLYFLINIFLCFVQCDLKSMSRKNPQKLIRLLNVVKPDDTSVKHNNNCENLPPNVLTDVLGAAFNSRYMSIEEPNYIEEDVDDSYQSSYTMKRNSELIQPFYVDDTYALDISDKPAWEVKHASEDHDENGLYQSSYVQRLTDIGSVRSKRDDRRGTKNIRNDRPWECEAKIKWIDLGPDYFPRFLRSVECTKKKCWYNHYVCKPRSFTVKLLRRRNGECVQTNQLNTLTNDELSGEFKELWVWEERAVNFCCDCAAA